MTKLNALVAFDKSGIWLSFFIFLFGLQAIFSIFFDWFPATKDLVAGVLALSLVLVLHFRLRVPRLTSIFLPLSFIPHFAGQYELVKYNAYYTGSLYGAPQLYYHYDWFVHFFAMFCISIAFSAMTFKFFMKGFRSKTAILFIVLFFCLGLGSLNEMMEFVGFETLGYGKGFLEYGAGDNSPYEGPWRNSSLDQVFNLFGGLVGTASYLLLKR